jgi:5-methylcytosine-specific restriction endonuclease McrA
MYGTTFNRRTSNSYHSHKKRARAAGQALDYTLDDLRKKVEGQTYCPYCGCGLTPENFACDHNVPTSRHGSFSLWNVVACCTPCNLSKGNLAGLEFEDLMDLVGEWTAEVRTAFLARLRRGGAFR